MGRLMRTAGAALALALVASPLVAQGAGRGPAMHGPMRGPAAMERNPAQVVLDHRERLELTEEQVERLEAVAARVQEQNGPRWERLQAAFGDVAPRGMSAEERDALRERMRELRPVREEIRKTNRAAGTEIHELLTDDQEAKLRSVMHRRRGGERGRRGPRGPGA